MPISRTFTTPSKEENRPVSATKVRESAGELEVAREGESLKLDRVTVRLGGQVIVSGIDLAIRAGEVVSLIGPSGCGKTTVLNVIAGLVPVESGLPTVLGRPIASPGPDRTVVFQEDAVFPWMTVEKNVEYALRLKRIGKSERRRVVSEMLELVGLAGKEKLYPKQLSGGMRKRVDLARAFAAQPQVLLMDEPYAALDQITKHRLQQEFLKVVQQNDTTAVFVTHDLEEAIFVAHRIVVMSANPGRIKTIFEVPFGPERESGLRMTQEFQDLRREISLSIHAEEQSK